MKKAFTSLVCSILLVSLSYAQSASATDEVSGNIVLPDNTTVTGMIKDNIRKKGELTIVNNGKKTKYKASEIIGAQVGTVHYITWNFTFYEILWQGKNLALLRKANEPANVQYNGTEAISITSDGKVDDLFVKKNSDGTVSLINKKTAKEVLASICSSCAPAGDNFDAPAIQKILEACDACK